MVPWEQNSPVSTLFYHARALMSTLAWIGTLTAVSAFFCARRSGSGTCAQEAGAARSRSGISFDLALHYAELFCAAVSIFVAFNRPSLFTFTDSVLYYSRSGIVGGSRAPAPDGIERRENEC